MVSKELQDLVESILSQKRRPKVMYTADRLRLEGRRQGLEEGLKQGFARGLKKVLAKEAANSLRYALLRLLRFCFGTEASHAEPRIQSVSPEQLNLWFDRAAFAATLDDVFREG